MEELQKYMENVLNLNENEENLAPSQESYTKP